MAAPNVGNLGGVIAERDPLHGLPASAALTLPPLATLFLDFDAAMSAAASSANETREERHAA